MHRFTKKSVAINQATGIGLIVGIFHNYLSLEYAEGERAVICCKSIFSVSWRAGDRVQILPSDGRYLVSFLRLLVHVVMGAYVQEDHTFFGDGEGEYDPVGRRDGYRVFPAELAF